MELTAELAEARIRSLVEEQRFFETHWLATEGLIDIDRFAAMFGIFGLAECVNLLALHDGVDGRYGRSDEVDALAVRVVERVAELVADRPMPYSEGGRGRCYLHSQGGIDIDDHADDAIALMDHLGWDQAVVVAWSLGVNVAFELAARHPERIAGLLSVAGVPGGTFDTLFAPQLVPRPLRRPMGVGLATVGRTLGSQINMLARTVPTGRPFAEWLRHTGFILPFADPADISTWATSMKQQDLRWYFELALALSRHDEVDPSFVECPVTIVSGAIDMLTSQQDVLRYAERIPHAEVHSLPGTHCLPLEFPDRIMQMLRDLYERADHQNELLDHVSGRGAG